MTVVLNATTLIKDIDTDDAWFEMDDVERIHLPGENVNALSVLSRKQCRGVLRGIQHEANAANKYMDRQLADVLTAERRAIRMTPNQWDIQLVEHYQAKSRQATAGEPLTPDQAKMVALQLAALTGTGEHWHPQTQQNIVNLDADLKQYFKMAFLMVSKRGELDTLLEKFQACVGNPPAERAREAKAAANNEIKGLAQQHLNDGEDPDDDFTGTDGDGQAENTGDQTTDPAASDEDVSGI